MGCALENLMLAAVAYGYATSATLLPGKLTPVSANPALKPVARVDLATGQKQQSLLYDAIPHRHTNRNSYLLKPLPRDFIGAIRQLVSDEVDVSLFLFSAEAERRHIADMISKANDVVYADPEVEQASERWVRMKWSEVQKFRDGWSGDESSEPPLTKAVRKFANPALMRFAFRNKLLPNTRMTTFCAATPLFGIIAVRDRYDQQQCLHAGRIWQRAHLLATGRGLAGRPVKEAVEWIDQQRIRSEEPKAMAALCDIMGDKSWQPTFMFRLGYPIRQVSPSRPVKDVLL
jgi:hypothetical protein